MNYCKICIQTDTRPNTKFSKDGICPSCNYFNSLKKVDWDRRFGILKDLVDQHKQRKENKFNSKFDCIIGVSGGKDSTRQALYIRDKLKLRPLLVCLAYPPEQVTKVGVKNLSNIINLGFDLEIISLAPKNWKKLLKDGFINYANFMKPSEQALFSSVPRLAIKYKIPLIFWGENPGLQVGDLGGAGKTEYDGNKMNFINTLKGGRLDWMYNLGYNHKDIINFEFPSEKEFKKNKLQIVYLGWFWKDWNIRSNGTTAALNGLNLRKDNFKNTQDLYGVFSLDEDWVTLNQMIKYYKFGFGRVTEYLNEDIRLGKISRERAIKIAEKYDGACGDKYIKSFCKYIGISKEFFWKIVQDNVNKKYFRIGNDFKIKPLFKVGKGLI